MTLIVQQVTGIMSEGRQGRRWTVTDAAGNPIYLTEERWEHICDGHPELALYEDVIRETIRKGRRYQDAKNPYKYYYLRGADNLPGRSTHIEVVVLLQRRERDGDASTNNYILTAYTRNIR
jgi:hypothetical protein